MSIFLMDSLVLAVDQADTPDIQRTGIFFPGLYVQTGTFTKKHINIAKSEELQAATNQFLSGFERLLDIKKC